MQTLSKSEIALMTISSNDPTTNSIDNYYSYPIGNITQILLDWLNTIKEPHCLLASDLQSLRNGSIFIEYLKHFLMRHGASKDEININPNLDDKKKLVLLLTAIIELSNGQEKEKAMQFLTAIDLVFSNDYILIELLTFLKQLFEKIESQVNYNTNTINSNKNEKNDDYNYYMQQHREKSFDKSELKKEEFEMEILSNSNISNNYNSNNINQREKKKKFNNLIINTSPHEKRHFSFGKSSEFTISSNNLENKALTPKNPRNNEQKYQRFFTAGRFSFPIKTPHPKNDISGNLYTPISLTKVYHPTTSILDSNKSAVKAKPLFNGVQSSSVGKTNNSHKYFQENRNININDEEDMKIKKWLLSLNLIKTNFLSYDIVELFSDGVLLCELLNRCEGRNRVIKGIIHSPINKSQVKLNFTRAFTYIKSMRGYTTFKRKLGTNFDDEIMNENYRELRLLIEALYCYYNGVIKTKPIYKEDYYLNTDNNKKWVPLSEYYQLAKKSPMKVLEVNSYNQKGKFNNYLQSNNGIIPNDVNKEEKLINQKNSPITKSNIQSQISQISMISGNQKEKNRSISNSGLLSSQDNSAFCNWKEIERKRNIISNQIEEQKKKNDKKAKVKCFLLFDKNSVGRMRKEMKRKCQF